MNLKDQLEEVKNNVHSGNEVAQSMDKLQSIVTMIYDDPEERDIMLNTVIDTKHDLLAGHPIDTFDETYLQILQGLAFSGKI